MPDMMKGTNKPMTERLTTIPMAPMNTMPMESRQKPIAMAPMNTMPMESRMMDKK